MNERLRNYGRNIANRLMPRRLWHQATNQIYDLLEQSSSVSASAILQTFVYGLISLNFYLLLRETHLLFISKRCISVFYTYHD
jgi:hypothetical protein